MHFGPSALHDLSDSRSTTDTVSSGLISTLNTTLLIIATGAAMIDSSNENAPYIDQDLVEQMVDEAVEGVDLQIGKPSRERYGSSHRTGNGKRIRVLYDHVRAYNSVMADYLGPVPIFNDRQFERVFRITKNRNEFIISNLAKYDSFWTHTHDAVGKPSISPHVQFLAASSLRTSDGPRSNTCPSLCHLGCNQTLVDN